MSRLRLISAPDLGAGVQARLFEWLTPTQGRDEARRSWQATLAKLRDGPGLVVSPEHGLQLRGQPRVGWRTHSGRSMRVSYGRWPADAPLPTTGAVDVLLVAWRQADASGSDLGSAASWAVDCAPAWYPPEGQAALSLYGGHRSLGCANGENFGAAWATLEAAAKLGGGLLEGRRPIEPQRTALQIEGNWCLALAEVAWM